MSKTIGQLMTPNPLTLSPDDLVVDSVTIFEENRFHHLPVVDSDGEAIGMVSNQDVDNYVNITRIISEGDSAIRIRDIMTKPIFAYYEDVSASRAASAMVDNNIHAIVVMNKNDEMSGILTATDLLRYLAELKD